ncbi:hypothetical protein GNI_068890 [Gregarina niphandrodes]|uniref:Uncharacterized protein n=1 Tax=Gregarina niphandrodes TaxID=110365 RepID=A0A023B7H6_GRENI|nr:hypothetical protein GNI_068890 [Gregarina niphandrodes]EZG67414.1 hypothetical protein GNI_068890 [Gregarina niphandrodes]|eukprot:XP_011130247.1 hypothetical protein GNI_068890 [Gregarina niphandrodes]
MHFLLWAGTTAASILSSIQQSLIRHPQLRRDLGIAPTSAKHTEQVDDIKLIDRYPYGGQLLLARQALSYLNGDSGILALTLPNLGLNQVERVRSVNKSVIGFKMAETTGNLTNAAILLSEEGLFRAFQPVEDARTLGMTARDLAIASRLDRRAQALDPIRDQVQTFAQRLDNAVDTIDNGLGRSALLPLAASLATVGRVQRRIMDLPGQAMITASCIANPDCCLNPNQCVEM